MKKRVFIERENAKMKKRVFTECENFSNTKYYNKKKVNNEI